MKGTIVKGNDGDMVAYLMQMGYWSMKAYG